MWFSATIRKKSLNLPIINNVKNVKFDLMIAFFHNPLVKNNHLFNIISIDETYLMT